MARVSVPDWWYDIGADQGQAVSGIFREVMADLPMTYTELAEKLGVAQSTVNRWARGQTDPDLGTMVRAVEAVTERLAAQTERADRARDVLAAVEGVMASRRGRVRRDAIDELDRVLGPELEQAREAIAETLDEG
jgi:transcriptional regulator with XRE-family HTH domain